LPVPIQNTKNYKNIQQKIVVIFRSFTEEKRNMEKHYD